MSLVRLAARLAARLAPSLAALALPGCLSLSVRTEAHDPALAVSGIVDGYVTPAALHPYDGHLIDAGLFEGDNLRRGEVAALDIWPLGGVGVGLVGARVRVLPLEIGLGTLFYEPSRPTRPHDDDDDDDAREQRGEDRADAAPHERDAHDPAE